MTYNEFGGTLNSTQSVDTVSFTFTSYHIWQFIIIFILLPLLSSLNGIPSFFHLELQAQLFDKP